MPSSRGPQYRVAGLDTPSTTNLLSPSGRSRVQAALVQGPRSLRATPSSTSLVGLFSFYSHSLLTEPFRTSLLILQQQVVEAPYRTQYRTRYSHTPDWLRAQPLIVPQFSLSPDPASWGSDLSPNHPEPDDFLHNPDPRRDTKNDRGGHIFTYRGLTNLGCLILLVISLVALLFVFP
jgi:hypothetical protein